MARATVQLNIRMDPDISDQFRDACAREGSSQQEVVTRLIRDWLRRQNQRHGGGAS
jgi:hypothetical protein